ncbi:hypothetical protein QRB36_24430, partial [Mycobacterium marseillense]|nr:hypothetical protein [Mycobacterium marseillense]
TAATARGAGRARRRRRGRRRGHGDEFMDMNVDVDPDWNDPATTASHGGAGNLGFAGTASKKPVAATGLATLAGDDFGDAPRMPMIPGTWPPEDGSGR